MANIYELEVVRTRSAVIFAQPHHLDAFPLILRFLRTMERMYEAMADLVGVSPGNIGELNLIEEDADHGALWAGNHNGIGFRIGAPPEVWGTLAATAERGDYISALVHELGHVAFAFSWDHSLQRETILWPGAVEGFATPIGAYACWKNNTVPVCIDELSGARDWLSLEDFANEMINNGLEFLENGDTGQASTVNGGHHPSAKIVESVVFDLLFHHFRGYDGLRTTLRELAAQKSKFRLGARSDTEKMEDFFIEWGRAEQADISPYVRRWKCDVERIAAGLTGLPPIDSPLPHRRDVRTQGDEAITPTLDL